VAAACALLASAVCKAQTAADLWDYQTGQARSGTMKKFLAIYIGTEAALEKSQWNELSEEKRNALSASGMQAWMDWGMANSAAIVDQGTPLGRTKRASAEGIADIKNVMTGYVIVQAESHAAAARLFDNHPHFTIFPGDSVEIMECLPLPEH
jgi:hypothetical protein